MTDDEKQEYWEKFFKEMSAECNRGNDHGGVPDIAQAFASYMNALGVSCSTGSRMD